MIKQKLIEKRKERNFSQAEIAQQLGITQSQYNRRENGLVKISKKEWDLLAKLLNVSLDEIYEPQDGVYIINNENANGNFGNHNIYQAHSDFALDTMKKYIEKLEQENSALLKENEQLRKIND
ncbi:MAG: helix-turn-helix transcriptional regulator [Xanthomarina gelatinilytica]|uniref:helix-turn-helix transcriptional regulator n=1 Tax=Xanthomarina gelatinilytica TaxID=1137281 RepID=UPI003A86A2A3